MGTRTIKRLWLDPQDQAELASPYRAKLAGLILSVSKPLLDSAFARVTEATLAHAIDPGADS